MANKLLVIDDSLTVRKMVELSFRNEGWSIDFAANGADGVSKALSTAPDLVLLDFVLPDMKATDVCERLAASPKGADLAVILMSAKMERVRDLFKNYPMVVDFVGKPFSATDILERAARARGPVKAPAPAPTPVAAPEPAPTSDGFSFKDKEVAANAVFQSIKRELASIPEWTRKLGAHPPALYFARKILTPEVVESILGGLRPLYRGLAPAEPTVAPAPEPSADGPSFSGQTSAFPLGDVLSLLASGGRTGELRIHHDDKTVLCYWQSGEVLLVTSLDPVHYANGGPDIGSVPPDELASAEAEQRASGKPIFVTLAARGHWPEAELPALLEERGRRMLAGAQEATAARFTFRQTETLPDYAESFGQDIEIAAAPQAQQTLAQLTLERLRRPSSWREAQLHLPGAEAVYARAAGFSARLVQLTVSANEQRVLTLIDGRHTVNHIAQRSGIGAPEVARILYRLAATDLVAAPLARPSSRHGAISLRPVMILEPDRDGFHTPLRELLAGRAEPLELIDLAGEPDLLGAIQRERPALVILNDASTDAADVARAIRSAPQLANVSLAAIVDSQVKARMDDLAAAGFDAVLVKPVLYSDLSKLIASSFLAANSVSRTRSMENHGEDTRR